MIRRVVPVKYVRDMVPVRYACDLDLHWDLCCLICVLTKILSLERWCITNPIGTVSLLHSTGELFSM